MQRKTALSEFIVPVYQQHTVSRCNSEQGNEPDYRRNADDAVSKEYREHASDEGQRNVVISRQIAESVDLIVQVKRLRDGSRRTTRITEVIGMEGDVIVTQELFKFEYLDESEDGKIIGEFRASGAKAGSP